MYIHTIKPAEGSKKEARRLGRGIGSGLGKTAGKGHKGQNARSGGGVRPGFEGGQIPLYRRIPKRGFNNAQFGKLYTEVSVEKLNKFEVNAVVDPAVMLEAGVISKIEKDGVKILGNGELKVALTVVASAYTKGAKEKIEAAGGKVEVK